MCGCVVSLAGPRLFQRTRLPTPMVQPPGPAGVVGDCHGGDAAARADARSNVSADSNLPASHLPHHLATPVSLPTLPPRVLGSFCFASRSVPDECPAEMVAIMQRCFALDPTTRPTAAELVELLAVVPGPPPHPHLHLQLSSMPSIPLQTSTGMHAASTDRGSAVDSGMVAAVAADGAGGRSISSRELQGSAPPPTHDRWQHERPPFVLRPVPSGSPFERARAARQVPEGEGPAKPCQLPERAGSLTGASPFSQVQP